MKRILLVIILISIFFILLMHIKIAGTKNKLSTEPSSDEKADTSVITGIIKPNDTMEAIFYKHGFSRGDLSQILEKSRDVYDLSRLTVGNIYFLKLKGRHVEGMHYEIDDSSFLKIKRTPNGFIAERVKIRYTKKIGTLYIKIKDNLIFSFPETSKEYLKLALKLSDIFAWDIDFSNDIRDNDYIKIIVEELWLGNVFKGYGEILSAEFFNNGRVYKAYRFEYDGFADYYNERGESLRKALLRSPLRFKYISSGFGRRRLHPVLRIYRPHLGVDYAAPVGTPVSAAGDGVVVFAGYKGQYGKMVHIRHNNRLETFYGHLSRIPKKIKRGVKVSQGEIIGYVGKTGLATGPHLDYRIKLNGRFVNPLKVRLPRGRSIPEHLRAEFNKLVEYMDMRMAELNQPFMVSSAKEKISS